MINYYLLTKPGIVAGNLVTVAAGFLMASKGEMHYWLFLSTLLGLALIMASACVFNNYIDRRVDGKMKRTQRRSLVSGVISGFHALIFGAILGVFGGVILLVYTNVLTFSVAVFGFFVYVVLYSLWKCHTVYGTAIGSIAGAVPPVVGYCAVSDHLDVGAWILFAMMVLWQMPHFYAIAVLHFDDYREAEIPVLPVKKGILKTKVHMVLYIFAFIMVATLLTAFGYVGYAYLSVAWVMSLLWLWLSLKGFTTTDDHEWSQDMFRWSLLVIMVICVAIPLDIP